MWPLSLKQEYRAVTQDTEAEEHDLDLDDGEDQSSPIPGRTARWPYLLGTSILLLAALGIAIYVFLPQATPGTQAKSETEASAEKPPSSKAAPNTSECALRREWRTLSRSKQQSYISAVKCLQTTPSKVSEDDRATAYDDFPWIHSHIGYTTHNSAPFLPWHRYFLHVYHQTLREKCGYTGELVYWDWTLDSEALEKSPIFDSETGFGGDGDINGEITVGRTGRCVTDGPFANTQISFYDVKYQPHCLSRGFRDGEGKLGHMDGHDISPASIEEVLSITDYEQFVTAMESKVHDAIPFGIAGDFETFTAPYDPIFFLHHTQLDRLWYLWQQRQPGRGLEAYSGRKGRHSMDMASLDDELQYRKLAPNVRVKEVMDIENELLCYRY